jgi:hypothetical protein
MNAALVVFWLLAGPTAQSAGSATAPACHEAPGYSRLDFWVGEWDVYWKGRKVGTNRISKILSGCAIEEDWVDIEGGRGKSLFYFHPREGTWKQVWITDHATRRGGTKEKTLTTDVDGGGVRFEGELPIRDARVRDRTTLWPLKNGRVRQLIEFSEDDGATWTVSFDGEYVRASAPRGKR